MDNLNQAPTLGRLEVDFYRRVLNWYGEARFESSDFFDGLGDYIRRRSYQNFQRISEHEDTHVQTLVSVIKSLGGTPVPVAEYNFGIKSVANAM